MLYSSPYMKIGNVKLESKTILAPMAGVNCTAFRLLCKEHGAGLVTTPMLVINQIVANKDKILEQTCLLKQEKPISIQLVGSDSQLAGEATEIIDEYADIIDINFGCPEKDILALKAGSFFVKHPEQMKKVVVPIINSTNKPVTAKIRLGWDDKSIRTVEIAKLLEDFGVSAIAIHGRTKEQKYTGKANWDEIKKAKEAVNIPVIGNGDIFKPGDAKAMLEHTGCDAVMVGRGAIGNPFIFGRINALLEKRENISEITEQDKIACFKKFLEYYKKYEKMRAFSELRQHAMWFTTGMKGAKRLRNDIMRVQSVDEILGLFDTK